MKTGWLKAEDAWYYLNSDGTMAKDWIQVDGTYYYLLNGAMVTGWLRIGNDYYYARQRLYGDRLAEDGREVLLL